MLAESSRFAGISWKSLRAEESDRRRLGPRGMLWVFGYAVTLGLAHYLVVGPKFYYLGFENIPPRFGVAVLLAVPYFLCARRLPASWDRPSALVYWALFLLVVAPVLVLPVFISNPDSSVWTMVVGVTGCFLLLGVIYSMRPPTMPRLLPLSPRAYWIGFAVLWAGMFALVISTYSLHFGFDSLSSFYDIRAQFKKASADVPKFVRYAIPWLGSVIAPIALAKGLIQKRYLWAIAAVVTELVLVSITGYKSLLFSAVAVIGVLIIARYFDPRRIGAWLAGLAASGVLIATVIDVVTDGTLLTSLFVRRLILVAAINTRYFFEFFSDFPKLHLGHSVLGAWVDYPYELSPANLMGLVYYGNPYTSANANVWADAFINFGVVGMVVFTLVLAVALLVLDSCTRAGAPKLLVLAPLAMTSISLANSALLTVFMTHGLMLTLILVYFMPVDDGPGVVGRRGRPGAERAEKRSKRRADRE